MDYYYQFHLGNLWSNCHEIIVNWRNRSNNTWSNKKRTTISEKKQHHPNIDGIEQNQWFKQMRLWNIPQLISCFELKNKNMFFFSFCVMYMPTINWKITKLSYSLSNESDMIFCFVCRLVLCRFMIHAAVKVRFLLLTPFEIHGRYSNHTSFYNEKTLREVIHFFLTLQDSCM